MFVVLAGLGGAQRPGQTGLRALAQCGAGQGEKILISGDGGCDRFCGATAFWGCPANLGDGNLRSRGSDMAAMPVLAIGFDPVWRARMQRLLATRGELDWLGAYAPKQPRRSGHSVPALLLLDGDDPLIERERRRPL